MLLSLELELRRSAGEAPLMEEYFERFPASAGLVHDVFDAKVDQKTTLIENFLSGEQEKATGFIEGLPDLADYRLEAEIGRGAMGVVYKGLQLSLNRVVAIKILEQTHRNPEEARKRFRFEALAAARLKHPNIVAVYDLVWGENRPYYVTEFTPLGSLAQSMRDREGADHRPMDPREAARLLETLARAIHHAHTHGIVHRDLKPGNVLIFPGPKAGVPMFSK